MQLILPKTLVHLRSYSALPLFFLAGPIRGGGDWQGRMCALLAANITGDFLVANPFRYPANHSLRAFEAPGVPDYFARQLAWERFYLQEAAQGHFRGCLIFWLPAESSVERRADGLPYAIETYGELGEWRGHLAHDPATRLVIGAEPEFPGLDAIQRNFASSAGPSFFMFRTMEQVARRAVEIATAEQVA